MILELIFNVISHIILGIIGLFPAFPKVDLSGLDGVFKVLSLIDTFVSVKSVSSCLVVVFVFMNIEVIWGVIMWVIRKIPSIQ